MNRLYKISLVLLVLGSASAKLSCFDCYPDDENNCTNPTLATTRSQVCDEKPLKALTGFKKQLFDATQNDIIPRANNDLQTECYTIYVNDKNECEKTGLYRGCVTISTKTIKSTCDFLKEEFSYIVACEACSEDNCNTKDLNGTNRLIISIGLILINALLLLFV